MSDHALLTIHDRSSPTHDTHLLLQDRGNPYGACGVISSLRTACRGIDPEHELASDTVAAAFVALCDPPPLPESAVETLDPRWFYELDFVRGRARLTVYDLHTFRADPQVFALTG